MKIRLLIWGIGKIYNSTMNLLRSYIDSNQIEIVGITAQNLPCFKTIDGFNLLGINELRDIEYDYLMVMSEVYYKEIVEEAVLRVGVPRYKIVSYHILEIPNFNFIKFDLIRKSNISIVSNNCWGGILYKTLGLECRSPFKNVSFSSNDYIKVISNLNHYLNIDPIWTGIKEIDKNQKREVPMLQLDDVFIKCNHDPDAENAIQNWKRRRKKFNWKNILVEMYVEDIIVEKEFYRVTEQFEKRICFVPYKSKEKQSVTLPLMNGQTRFFESVNSNAGIGNNAVVYNILNIIEGCIDYRIGY